MPELPDITSYLVALRPRIVGQPLEKILVKSPFLVRTVEPDLFSLTGQAVHDLSRIGKRIVWHFGGRAVSGVSFDDRGPVSLEETRRKAGEQEVTWRRLRFLRAR